MIITIKITQDCLKRIFSYNKKLKDTITHPVLLFYILHKNELQVDPKRPRTPILLFQ